jgi:pimeloyl-ACP methyl ester carboxylesterase
MFSLRRRLAVAVASAVSLVGISAGTPAAIASPSDTAHSAPTKSPKLDWKSCGKEGQCASLTVPLDYAQPDNGKTMKIALSRVRATDSKRRIGSLLMNPGGPGAPGVQFVQEVAGSLPDQLRRRFDIVGFDPRGTGKSQPVKCQPNLDGVFNLDYSPDTPEERARLDTELQKLARSCEQRSGSELPYVSSESTARDMDRIRQAVGDKKLTYIGYSYGTYLGTLYAKLFPNKVRALVLDGAVDPNLSGVQLGVEQAVGFENALDAFLAQCAANPRCSFYNAGDPTGAFDRLAAQIDARPLRAGSRVLSGGEFDIGVAQALYTGKFGYRVLEQALAAAQRGDGAKMLDLSDQYTGRQRDGTYDSSQPAFWAIGCLDGPAVGPPDAFQAAEAEFRAAAPRIGVSLLNYGLVCAYWPVPPVKSVSPITVDGAPPIMIVGTTGDPATPLKWAEGLSKDISSSVLVVAEGSQHTSFLLAQNSCVDALGIAYLVDGTAPPADTNCPF